MKRRRWNTWLSLILGLSVLAGGCVPFTASPLSVTPIVSTPELPADATSVVTPTPSPTLTDVSSGAPPELTMWIIDMVAPAEGTGQSQLFAQQVVAFRATHPDLSVQVLRKKRDGKGGMRDFLTTANAVAPAVMPDLIVLDTQTLTEMALENLLVPLDGLMSAELLSDLYPFAIEACMVEGSLVCIQFQASIEHAVYNTSKIAVAPLTWNEVFASGATFIFPMAGQDEMVNDAFLVQYLSTGAKLVDAGGEPALDVQALTDVLTFYRQGIDSGVILSNSLTFQKVEDCWPSYLQAEVAISNVSSGLYLAGRSLLEPVSLVTSIPTHDGQAVSLSRGYAWAITTRDPARQPMSAKMLEWLMYSPYVAAWNQAAGQLPTRRSAFEQLPRDTYNRYMYTQFEYTQPYVLSKTHQRIYRAMQDAIDAVLKENVPPEGAAAGILKAVGQEATP